MKLLDILLLLPQHLSHVSENDNVPTVQLDDTAETGTYFIADILMKVTNWILGLIDQTRNDVLFTWVYAILVFLLAMAVGVVVRWIVLFIVRKLGDKLYPNLNSAMLQHHFYLKLVRIVPALVFLILIQFTLITKAGLAMWLTRLTWIYVVYVVASAFSSLAIAIWEHLNARANKRKLPLKGLIQLIQGVVWILALIISVAILFNKSPGSLLAGLGAFAAVLMLVFKDSILGVVAGVQLAENDSLHVGDWISIPGGEANGTVIEVALTAVKIQNWDKTVSTIPPYSLITNEFKNYRPMQESNTRRIQRCYMIDADSVIPVDDKMLEEFSKIPLLADWLKKKLAQKAKGEDIVTMDPDGLVDGSIDTNLGIFRAYAKLYLDNNKYVDKNSDCFVTTLAQTSAGIPLQVYCFTSTSKWFPYEAIQASIFEHFAVMLYRFHLYTFENASGRDTIIDGYLSPGKDPRYVYGFPYPFFRDDDLPSNPGIAPEGVYPPVAGAPSTAPTAAPAPQPGAGQASAPNSGQTA